MSKVDWDAVYDQQAPRLYNFLRYRTGNSETAKDLTAQVMLKAWRHRASYQDEIGTFTTWLFQIARNAAVDHYRKQKHSPLPLYDVHQHASDFSLETEVQKLLDADKLYCLLQKLPERDQEIIALKYGADMTNRDIAEVLKLTESNVGTILHRTIKTLRSQWEMTYARTK
ncbi:MAG: sigma-70 family RNA polymerase sigma factor [Chloroflexota bacterium]